MHADNGDPAAGVDGNQWCARKTVRCLTTMDDAVSHKHGDNAATTVRCQKIPTSINRKWARSYEGITHTWRSNGGSGTVIGVASVSATSSLTAATTTASPAFCTEDGSVIAVIAIAVAGSSKA